VTSAATPGTPTVFAAACKDVNASKLFERMLDVVLRALI
jgi:hypothetical protein